LDNLSSEKQGHVADDGKSGGHKAVKPKQSSKPRAITTVVKWLTVPGLFLAGLWLVPLLVPLLLQALTGRRPRPARVEVSTGPPPNPKLVV